MHPCTQVLASRMQTKVKYITSRWGPEIKPPSQPSVPSLFSHPPSGGEGWRLRRGGGQKARSLIPESPRRHLPVKCEINYFEKPLRVQGLSLTAVRMTLAVNNILL